FTGGDTPVQSSVGGQFGSEINNIPALHDSVRRVVGFGGRRHLFLKEVGSCFHAGFHFEVINGQTPGEFDFRERNFRGGGGRAGELHPPKIGGDDRLRAEGDHAHGRTVAVNCKWLQVA